MSPPNKPDWVLELYTRYIWRGPEKMRGLAAKWTKPRRACSQRVRKSWPDPETTFTCPVCKAIPLHVWHVPPSIVPWSSHAYNAVASAEGLVKRSNTSEISEFFQFQYQLKWCFSSFYCNEFHTEAAWSFHVVSKLPVCTLQSNLAGSASPLFFRSLVSTHWPWPSWQ